MKNVKKTAARMLARRAAMREKIKTDIEKMRKKRIGMPVRTMWVARKAWVFKHERKSLDWGFSWCGTRWKNAKVVSQKMRIVRGLTASLGLLFAKS